METRAHHLYVGTVVLLLLAGLVSFGIWLASVRVGDDSQRYFIFFTGSVTGLQNGSPVRYRGIQVGKVVDLRIDPVNVERIRATIEVPKETPIKTDSQATLEYQGITGALYVQIVGGSQEAPRLRDVTEGIPVIPSAPSSIAEVFDAAPQLLARADAVVGQLQVLLSDENVAAISATLANVEAASADVKELTASLRRTTEGITLLLDGLDIYAATLTDSLDSTLAAARETMEGLDTEISATGQGLRELARAYRGVSEQLGAFLEENSGAIAEFTRSGLTDLSQLAIELRDLSASLGRISNAVENNPAGFLFGGQRPGVPVD